jgi:hypothetical protein
MFRRKNDQSGKPAQTASTYAGRPGQEESMRVLAAFLAQPAPAANAPGAPGPGPAPGAPLTPPGSVPGAATPGPPPPLAVPGWSAGNTPAAGNWAGSNPAPPPALNTQPLIGAEDSLANRPTSANNISVPIPGLGSVSPDRFKQVYEHVNALVTRLSGGADLSERWTPDQVRTALAGLEAERARGSLTEEQYQSLKAALESMLVP